MARNIAQNGALTPRMAGTLRSDDQNIKRSNANRNRNRFDMSYQNLMSLRFGEVRPFYYQQVINEDTQIFSNSSELWTMQMKSPLMSNFVGYKDYFYVPMKCILPNVWEIWKNNPLQEDDVPSNAYCTFPLEAFISRMCDFCSLYSNNYRPSAFSLNGNQTYYQSLVKFVVLWMSVMSSNSLPIQLGINYQSLFYPNTNPYYVDLPGNPVFSLDELYEKILSSPFPISEYVESSSSDTPVFNPNMDYSIVVTSSSLFENSFTFRILYTDAENIYFDISGFRNFFSFMTSLFVSDVSDTSYSFSGGCAGFVLDFLMNRLYQIFDTSGNDLHRPNVDIGDGRSWDFSPVYAYHLVGKQFYVNDQIDKVYTADEYLSELYNSAFNYGLSSYGINDMSFDYNGHLVNYDLFSNYLISDIINTSFLASIPIVSNVSKFNSFLSFFLNIFLPFESLRYGDYFTGSRLNPLALGADPNSYAPVVSNEVQSLDMVQAMSYLNYYNDVNKIGATAWIQENGIYGSFPQSLDPMPRFISRSKFSIGEMQVENTSDTNTGDIVSRGRSNDSSNGFAIDISESAIVLGLVSFDCPRIYQNVTDRLAFVKDRFDIFNPYFQNIGDQPILESESSMQSGSDTGVWAWQIRNTEYKQRLSVASGAFVGTYFLPSWAFVTDSRNSKLSSFFIRNHSFEFDRFFVSLPNVSNAGYFHFYVRFFNRAISIRAMQDKPDIQTPKIHQ